MSLFVRAKQHLCSAMFLALTTTACSSTQTAPVYPEAMLLNTAKMQAADSDQKEQNPEENQFKVVLDRFTRSCNGGDGAACFHLSRLFEKGETTVAADDARAVEFLKKACDAGFVPAMALLADRFAHARGVDWDEARAVDLYMKSCDAGDTKSCLYGGNLLDEGRGVTKDEDRAMALFRRACSKGESAACIPMNTKACDVGDAPSCHQLALTYHEGRGVIQDKNRANALFEQACKGGAKDACIPAKFRVHLGKLMRGAKLGGYGACRGNPDPSAPRITTTAALELTKMLNALTPENRIMNLADEPPRMNSSHFTDIPEQTGEAWIQNLQKLLAAPETFVFEIREEIRAFELLEHRQVTDMGLSGKFKPGLLRGQLVRFDSKGNATCATAITLKNTFLRVTYVHNLVREAHEQLVAQIPDAFGF
jgi:TPR repeat protein